MINKILQGFIKLIIGLANVILWPLETAINALMPNLSAALNRVSIWITNLRPYITWVISYTGLTPTTMSIVVSLITASVMIPLTAHAIKLGLKWYNALKL